MSKKRTASIDFGGAATAISDAGAGAGMVTRTAIGATASVSAIGTATSDIITNR